MTGTAVLSLALIKKQWQGLDSEENIFHEDMALKRGKLLLAARPQVERGWEAHCLKEYGIRAEQANKLLNIAKAVEIQPDNGALKRHLPVEQRAKAATKILGTSKPRGPTVDEILSDWAEKDIKAGIAPPPTPEHIDIPTALEYFGLKPLTLETILMVTRATLHKLHPDKGGDAAKFGEAQKFAEVLKRNYK